MNEAALLVFESVRIREKMVVMVVKVGLLAQISGDAASDFGRLDVMVREGVLLAQDLTLTFSHRDGGQQACRQDGEEDTEHHGCDKVVGSRWKGGPLRWLLVAIDCKVSNKPKKKVRSLHRTFVRKSKQAQKTR